MHTWWLIPIISAFFLSVIFTEMARRFALWQNVVDVPDRARKTHKASMPLLGGGAIFASFAIVTLLVLFYSQQLTIGEITNRHILGFLFGGWVLIIGGYLDDKYELPPKVSIVFPVIATVLAIASGLGIEKITNPFQDEPFLVPSILSHILTFIWMMGLIYTTKLLDGLDGLATGVSAIGALMIAMLALSVAFYQPDVALLAFIAFATLMGFLLWNTHPAVIFLGEGGSTFVGYLIGGLAVISGSKIATILLVLGIPALDVAFVMWDRYRHHRPIFHGGDRRHLHHKLLALGWSQRQVVFFYYAIAIIFGVTTLVFASWQKILALFALFVMMAVLIHYLSKKDI